MIIALEKKNSKFYGKIIDWFVVFIFFSIISYLLRFKIIHLPTNVLDLLVVIVILFWFFSLLVNKRLFFDLKGILKETKIIVFSFALIFFGLILSTVFSNFNNLVALGIIKSWFLIPFVFGFLILSRLRENNFLLSHILEAYFLGAVILSLAGLFFVLGGRLTYDGRLRLFFDSPNQFSMYLVPALLIGIFYFLKKWPKKEKLNNLWLIGVVVIALNLFFTYSFGAWLAFGLSMVSLLYRLDKKKLVFFFALIFLVVCALTFIFKGAKLGSILHYNERSSLASRIMIWKSSILMIKEHPIAGIGPGNFQKTYLGYQKYFPPYLEWAVPQPHNLFFAVYLQSGIAGVVGFGLLLWDFFKKNKKDPLIDKINCSALIFSIMLSIIIHGLVDTTYWRNDLSLIFWMLIFANQFNFGKALKKPAV